MNSHKKNRVGFVLKSFGIWAQGFSSLSIVDFMDSPKSTCGFLIYLTVDLYGKYVSNRERKRALFFSQPVRKGILFY